MRDACCFGTSAMMSMGDFDSSRVGDRGAVPTGETGGVAGGGRFSSVASLISSRVMSSSLGRPTIGRRSFFLRLGSA